MKRWLLILALILPFAFPLAAQNVRFDLPIYTTQAQGGNLLPVYAIPGAGIKFYSCSGSTCTTLATTYISATSSTTCPVSPTPMQVTLNGSSTCVSSADPYGNMGGWFQPGQYMATITAQGASYNYYFTVGVGPGGVGCFPNTIANGCTGATTQLGANGTLGIPGPVQNVVNYGAVGDGVLLTATGTDNYSAIQNAINTGLIAKQPVFFPCGIYEISHPLTMYGLTSVPLVGPAGPCALIQYNGGSTAQGVLTIAGSQPATPCTSASCDHTTGQPTCCASYYQQDNLGIVGNSSTPDVLDLLGVGMFDIENAILVGSSTTELFCMSCGPSGHSLNLNLAYNALFSAYGYTPYHTPTHLKVDGYSSNSVGNQLVFDGLISEFAGTNGIWITRGVNITFSNCQLSGNPVNVQLDGGANIIFDHGCLLEAGAAAGAVNITTGAVATEFRDASISGLLTVDGSGTTIDGGGYGPITLNSDATSTSIKNVDCSVAISNFVSNEPDVNIDNMYSSSTGAVLPNFPATRFTPQSGPGVTSGVVFLSGLWSTSGAAQKLDPTPLPIAATPWRAVFDGRWITSGGVPGAPTHQEVTDSSPSFTLAGGGTITVSVSGGYLSFSGSSLGGNVFFGGKVAFYPAVTSDSASFAGNVNALAYEVNGSLLSTTNLADWTNSGVANGDVPVWNSSTGQWTPGVNGGFVNPMTTLGDVIYGGTSGAATRLAGQTSSGTECLTQTGTGSASAAPVWGSCAGSAATAFSAITGSTNNSGQAMVVGSTSSLDYSGTGLIDANEVNGAAVAASAGFLASNSSRQLVAAAYTPANCTAGTTGSDCLQLSSGLVPVGNIPTGIPIGNVGSAGLSGTAPVAISAAGAISMHVADASDNGYLSSTDWSTFNGKQAALLLVQGTYVDGDLCSYTASGTLLNCNTAPGGTGNMSDGSGTSSSNYFPLTNGTTHDYTPTSPSATLAVLGAARANGNQTPETSSFSATCPGSYRINSGTVTVTLPSAGTTGCLIAVQNVSTTAATISSGTVTLNGPTSLAQYQSILIQFDGTNFNGSYPPVNSALNGGPVGAAQGGTGTTSLTGIRYANGGSADTAATSANLLGVCTTCVVASSPGAGVAHFAGSTQTVTSSAVSLTADVSGILPSTNGGTGVNNTATLTLGSSNQNWASLGTGIVKNTTITGALSIATAGTDYVVPSGSITGTAANLSGTPALPNGTTATTQSAGNNSTDLATTAYGNTVYNLIQTSGSPYTMSALTGFYWNNSSGAYSFDLPASVTGLQLCFGNYETVAHAISLIPGSGVTIYFTGIAGTAGSGTGLVSGGAAGDYICLVGTENTVYEAIGAGVGTWTNH